LSDWEDIVARVRDQILTVANVGQVHDRRRFIIDGDGLEPDWALATVGDELVLRCWTVSLDGMPQTKREAGGQAKQWNRRILIQGYLAINQAAGSENTAVTLAEQIMTVLDIDSLSGLSGLVMRGSGPCVLQKNQPQFFGIWAAHYVEILLPVFSIENLP
jgi:hypothetical protein